MNERRLQSGWEGVLLSFFMPGAGQWVAGRRLAGVAWLFFFSAACASWFYLILSPAVPTIWPATTVLASMLVLWFLMLLHAHRGVPRPADRAHRRPALAGLLSALLPGLGQLYNAQWFKAVGFFLLAGTVTAGFAGSAYLVPSDHAEWLELGWSLVNGGLALTACVCAYRARAKRETGGAPLSRLLVTVGLVSILAGEVISAIPRRSMRAFKIPTPAMAPTLHGRQWLPDDERERGLADLLLRGELPVRVIARASGLVEETETPSEDKHLLTIDGERHQIHNGLTVHHLPGTTVEAGDLLASGVKKFGDRLLVNTWAYCGSEPARGDIVVFSSRGMDDARVRPDTYYIKRIAGLPGERVSIKPSYLYINGEQVKEPKVFDDIANGRMDYRGFKTGHLLANPRPVLGSDDDEVLLGEDEYLVLGDNSDVSLDGRYFGAIQREQIIGKAIRVIWPLDRQRVLLN